MKRRPRRSHPDTIPGARYTMRGNERVRTSVAIHVFRDVAVTYSASERETLSRRRDDGSTAPRGESKMTHVVGFVW